VSRDRDDAFPNPGRLGEPATEQYVGRRDLTHWSRAVRAFTDVMAGWLLGLAWTAMVITCHRLYLTVRREQSSATPPVAR